MAQDYFALGIQLARNQTAAAKIRALEGEPIRVMRETARELGIVDLLLFADRAIYSHPYQTADVIRDVLIRLGVSNEELTKNCAQGSL